MMVFQILGFLLSAMVALFLFYIIIGFAYLFIRYVLPWAVLAVVAYALCGCNTYTPPRFYSNDPTRGQEWFDNVVITTEQVAGVSIDLEGFEVILFDVEHPCPNPDAFACTDAHRKIWLGSNWPEMRLAHELGHVHYGGDEHHTHTEWFAWEDGSVAWEVAKLFQSQ
jgi:hypothetical protein